MIERRKIKWFQNVDAAFTLLSYSAAIFFLLMVITVIPSCIEQYFGSVDSATSSSRNRGQK